MGQLVKVAGVGDIPSGQGKCVEINGKKIAIFHVDGAYYALDDDCPHKQGPLSEGEIDGNEILCPWHGASFDLKTGAVTGGPAANGVQSYKITVDGSDIKLEA